MKDLKFNYIIVDKNFISRIYNKTEVYDSDSIKLIKYACLFVSDNEAVALEFDDEGNNYMKSLMCIDEENDIFAPTGCHFSVYLNNLVYDSNPKKIVSI